MATVNTPAGPTVLVNEFFNGGTLRIEDLTPKIVADVGHLQTKHSWMHF